MLPVTEWNFTEWNFTRGRDNLKCCGRYPGTLKFDRFLPRTASSVTRSDAKTKLKPETEITKMSEREIAKMRKQMEEMKARQAEAMAMLQSAQQEIVAKQGEVEKAKRELQEAEATKERAGAEADHVSLLFRRRRERD